MTPQQIELVKSSWKSVEPISVAAAALFYGRLFEIAPEVKPLFAKADMKEQGAKLMKMIGMAVASLDRLDEIMPAVTAMAQRHVEYGVKPEDYQPVGAALLWTLEKGLGDAFTPDTKEAWTTVYTTLAGAMIAATE
ncbi:globin domain-containing protein [Blastopirellula sp. JC732]|uniref:Globin domain-containing protein n=1 Tax=Blastopirellula sediminis TaxID=2894196 RepID=A0A9X1MRV9_9BACT|nr:globin family protein [Blastopirellula sediminis]MCC9605079.1 globin domain-containing protein [Blastopirellula sediminis]MCC9631621.1 globin domain-containing protein [Blastopirellula sediminis]